MSNDPRTRFFYPRHFLLLGCFTLLLVVMGRLRPTTNLSVSFALYGALHASALVLALRARYPLWRNGLFIGIAASLSVMTLRIGIFGTQLSAELPAYIGVYAVLGFSALLGAVIYGILIRLFSFYELAAGSLAAISIGCMLASLLALGTLSHVHFLGPWWLAVLWWYAFSGVLWYCDRHASAVLDIPRAAAP
jgi:hypothetical protein